MAADSTLALQAAIVAALKADDGVTTQIAGRVYDRAPESVEFPYVSIGGETSLPWEAQNLDGWDVTIQIDTWSREPGRVEARQIMSEIASALHNVALTVNGHALVMAVLEFQGAMGDPDGITTHGVQRFRFVTHS